MGCLEPRRRRFSTFRRESSREARRGFATSSSGKAWSFRLRTLRVELLLLALTPAVQDEPPRVALVVGVAGEPAYGELFEQWCARWESAAAEGGARATRIDAPDGDATDRERLRAFLEETPRDGRAPLWLVLLGHGTFDGERALFNLRGPDVGAAELAEWLAPFERPVVVVVCAAASAPFLQHLSAPGRVVVTATRSGHEVSFSWFGEALSLALTDTDADLDQDRQVSLLEAFRFASARTAERYADEARLATEHALIDDNGDARGSEADAFRGVRALAPPGEGLRPDGVRAHQLHLVPSAAERALSAETRARRDALELAVEELRARKEAMGEEAYYRALEERLLELARLYRDGGR